ncbi:hypothetical protein D3C72_887280 [compost metagenome]
MVWFCNLDEEWGCPLVLYQSPRLGPGTRILREANVDDSSSEFVKARCRYAEGGWRGRFQIDL